MKYRKMIAPTIITVIMVVLVAGQATIFFAFDLQETSPWVVGLGLMIPLGIIIAMIYVLIERIREIKSGEEDDLDNY